MDEIYDSAKDVVVWLGEDPGYALKAISLIQKVSEIAHKEVDHTHPRYSHVPYEEIKARDGLPATDHPDWEYVEIFYGNAWFRRVWVIQEVARGNALMVMGRQEIALLDVSARNG